MDLFFLRFVFIVIALVFGAQSVAAQPDSLDFKQADLFRREIMRRATAYDNLRVLCKQAGPRISGSKEAQKAVELTTRMLRAAGADTVYWQPCMVPHWLRGEAERGALRYTNGKTVTLRVTSLGNTDGTGKAGLRAPVVEVTSFEELEALGRSALAGKIVFFNFPMNPEYVETFRAYGECSPYRTRGASRAARFGAVGMLVRSLASNTDGHPHTGVQMYADSLPQIPALAICTEDADLLSEALKANRVKDVYLRNTSRMLPEVESYNVVGELRGSEQPNTYLTVGGHLDAWDLGEGAHDDGAGCVQSIEVLRTFKALGYRPKHSLRIVMFMNEENGLRGATKYAELAEQRNETHLFALESDAGGFSPRGFSLDMPEVSMKKIQSWLPVFEPINVHYLRPGGGGADINPLKKLGAKLAGLRPDPQRYFDLHHAATDVFEQVNKRELHLGALAMTILVYLVDKYGL